MTVLWFLLSYAAFFCVVLLIASAFDTAGRVILHIFCHLNRTVLPLVFAVSALSTYLGIVGYCWLASATRLHVSCAMFAVIVIMQYSSDSVRFRTARALALLSDDNTSERPQGASIAQAEVIGHAVGFALAGLAYLRGSPVF